VSYISEALATLRDELGDQLSNEPGSENLLRLYALLAMVKGTETTQEDVHHAWSLWMETTNPGHPSIVPFNDLSADTRREDEPFLQAIHRAASRLRP
jgi:hypothetical protein